MAGLKCIRLCVPSIPPTLVVLTV